MKVHQIGAFEAKTKLSALLEQVQRGQVFHITKRGKSIAVLRSIEEPTPSVGRKGSSLGKRLRALRARTRKGPQPLKELIAFGRR
jgi:prevent-host-death family protein